LHLVLLDNALARLAGLGSTPGTWASAGVWQTIQSGMRPRQTLSSALPVQLFLLPDPTGLRVRFGGVP
jgi:hypothetical protein